MNNQRVGVARLQTLRPFERGQIAHVVSNVIGAIRFSEAEQVPPAEWLCVFDPTRRYELPGTDLSPEDRIASFFDNTNQEPLLKLSDELDQNDIIIPFDLYGLDSDDPPNLDNLSIFKHSIPDTAWNAFISTIRDKKNRQTDIMPAFTGHWAVNPSPLCERLYSLGIWLSKVANQPAAIWWVAQQVVLHPDIQQLIHSKMKHDSNMNPVIRQAWRYLFESWSHQIDAHQGYDNLKNIINQDGWNHQVLRSLIVLQQPFIKIEPNFWKKRTPPEDAENIGLTDLLKLEVEYPLPPDEIEVNDEWLAIYIKGMRKNLEHAVLLDKEINGLDRFMISTISGNRSEPYSLSSQVIFFSQLFERLVKLDISSAKQEFTAWQINDNSLFDRLRIWAAGMSNLVSQVDLKDIFLGISDEIFWDSYSQRDILFSLSGRWNDLSEDSRKVLEKRIVTGRPPFNQETEEDFLQSKAWEILNRLHWLADHGCQFSFDLESLSQALQEQAPFWKYEQTQNAVDSIGYVRGGYVSSNEDYSELKSENLVDILPKALEISGRREDFLVENDPYAGLCREKPIKAFSALTQRAKINDFPERAWRSFLCSPQREQDPTKFNILIAERIANYPAEKLFTFIRPICNWLKKIGKSLATNSYTSYLKIIDKLLDCLELSPDIGGTSIIRNNSPVDWVFETINSTVGDLVEILLYDPNIIDLKLGVTLPSPWLSKINRLLSLPTELKRLVYVQLASRLDWFYYWDSTWTEAYLLAILDSGDNNDLQAFWSGFLRSRLPPHQNLYMQLKPHMLSFAKNEHFPRDRREKELIAHLLGGWGRINEQNSKRCISNEELHDLILHWNDDARNELILRIEGWCFGDSEAWTRQLPELFQDAWPRQKAARTPIVSSSLFKFTFSSLERFEQVASSILPLLTPFKASSLSIHGIDFIVGKFPEMALEIYYKVFSENFRTDLPSGLGYALDKIGEVNKNLRTDYRWLKLKRKFDDG